MITGTKIETKDRIGLELPIPNLKKAVAIVSAREGKTITDYITELLMKDSNIEKEIKALNKSLNK